jgi:hypothetical protein
MAINPASSVTVASSIALRISALAVRLHRLGPRPIYEWACEVVAGSSNPLGRLEVFAALDPHTVAVLGGDRMPPNIYRVK